MQKLKKHGYAELEIITKGGQKTNIITSCKLAFDIVKNQKTRGVYIAEDSTETLAINYDDICMARAVALKGTTQALGYAEKREMRCRSAYIPRKVMPEQQGEEVTREDEERDEQEDISKEPQGIEEREQEAKEKPCPQTQKPFGGVQGQEHHIDF